MSVLLKLRKVGGSMMAAIPAEEVRRLKVGVGDVVSAELKPVTKSMFGAAKGKLGPFTSDDRWNDRD